MERLEFWLVSSGVNEKLVEPFSEGEIWVAMCSCNEGKELGPDGFIFFIFISGYGDEQCCA